MENIPRFINKTLNKKNQQRAEDITFKALFWLSWSWKINTRKYSTYSIKLLAWKQVGKYFLIGR